MGRERRRAQHSHRLTPSPEARYRLTFLVHITCILPPHSRGLHRGVATPSQWEPRWLQRQVDFFPAPREGLVSNKGMQRQRSRPSQGHTPEPLTGPACIFSPQTTWSNRSVGEVGPSESQLHHTCLFPPVLTTSFKHFQQGNCRRERGGKGHGSMPAGSEVISPAAARTRSCDL